MVLCHNEFSLSNSATLSATWALKVQQPEISCKQAKKERKTGFGTVDPNTGQLLVSFADAGNADTFKKHLKKIQYTYPDKKKIIIYLDNVSFHHSKKIKSFLKSHPQFEMRYLPPYSPDLNPVERVWWYMRKHFRPNNFSFCIIFVSKSIFINFRNILGIPKYQ